MESPEIRNAMPSARTVCTMVPAKRSAFVNQAAALENCRGGAVVSERLPSQWHSQREVLKDQHVLDEFTHLISHMPWAILKTV
jgi:hypothetical protein